jgi:signal peptidase I
MTSVEIELDRPPRRSRTDRTGRRGGSVGTGLPDRAGRPRRSGRPEGPERFDGTEAPDRPEDLVRTGRLERVGDLERVGGLDGTSRFDRGAIRGGPDVVFEGTFRGPLTPVRPAATTAGVTTGSRVARRRAAARRRRRRALVNAFAALVVAVVGAACVSHALGLWQADIVLSGSMRPGIQPGDIEIFRPEPAAALRVGQILAFHPPHSDFAVAHRVIRISRVSRGRRAHGTWIVTKGDANKVSDPWGRVRVTSSSVQTVRWVVPMAGWLAYWVGYPWLRLALMALAVGLAAILVLEWAWRT